MFKIKIFLLAALVFVALPQSTFAYSTTEQTATKLDADTYLFTVTYKFGFLNRELKMPVGAVRGLRSDTTSPLAGYVIQDEGKSVVTKGNAYSIVLSDAKVEDNEYYLPMGKSATFTLVTVLNLAPGMVAEANADSSLSLLMTALPFTMVNEGKEVPGRVDPLELNKYVTPELSIK